MTKLRLHYAWTREDFSDPSPLSAKGPSYLTQLAPRSGSAPRIVARTMPQRQVPESIDAAVRTKLNEIITTIAAESPERLEIKPSHTEGGSTDGLYARTSTNELVKGDKILKSEIAHVHPSDDSLHVWLSEADARRVVESGWGLRFPLKFVNKGWVMVYAPRTMKEVKVCEEVVRAGVRWVCGDE
jgi:Family of unknown function (DUF5519)